MVPSSVEAEASAVTESGALPLVGVTLRTATGAWLAAATVMAVVAEPESAFIAVKDTGYGFDRTSAEDGVQLSVPLVWAVLDVKVAPAGRLDRSAVSELIDSPSGSAAVAVMENAVFATAVMV